MLTLGLSDDSLEIPSLAVITGQAARSDIGEGPANAPLPVTEGEADAYIAGLGLAPLPPAVGVAGDPTTAPGFVRRAGR